MNNSAPCSVPESCEDLEKLSNVQLLPDVTATKGHRKPLRPVDNNAITQTPYPSVWSHLECGSGTAFPNRSELPP